MNRTKNLKGKSLYYVEISTDDEDGNYVKFIPCSELSVAFKTLKEEYEKIINEEWFQERREHISEDLNFNPKNRLSSRFTLETDYFNYYVYGNINKTKIK